MVEMGAFAGLGRTGDTPAAVVVSVACPFVVAACAINLVHSDEFVDRVMQVEPEARHLEQELQSMSGKENKGEYESGMMEMRSHMGRRRKLWVSGQGLLPLLLLAVPSPHG